MRAEDTAKRLKPDLIEKQLGNPDKCDFFVPDEARREYKDDKGHNKRIAHLKTSVGSGLNKALAAVEDAKQNDEMIAAARAKITEEHAKTLILERFRQLLTEEFHG